MNQKGFSLVEIMATFILITVILVLLVQLLLSLKDIYKEGDLKTTHLINQANMERRIYDDMFDSKKISISSCGTNCINITTDKGVKELSVNNNKIKYDNYQMELASGAKVGNLTYNITNETVSSKTVTIYEINLPVTNNLIEGDYGIHVLAQVGAMF